MNYGELIDSVRSEAKIEAKGLTATIMRLIQSKYDEYTARNKYPELFIDSINLFAEDGVGSLLLPVDADGDAVQHLHSVFFDDYELAIRSERIGNSTKRHRIGIEGPPWSVRYSNPYLLISPYNEILTTSEIVVSYYRSYTFVNIDDEHPVTRLEDTVINAVISRLLAVIDTKTSRYFKQLEMDAYTACRAYYAGK